MDALDEKAQIPSEISNNTVLEYNSFRFMDK